MADVSKLCPSCMKEITQTDVSDCPFCKHPLSMQNDKSLLAVKTLLQNRYVVGRVLSRNGEGATYIGYDAELNMPVRIREFFPSGLCGRIQGGAVVPAEKYSLKFNNELNSFLSLARGLARMRSLSALLPVYDIFEQNGTAYYISETLDAITLHDFLIRNGGSLTFDQLSPMVMPLMQTLSSLHNIGIVHRGISPDTLLIGKDGKLRITEFCVADARTANSGMAAHLFRGYAALEQYTANEEQGPWTDVYGLATTIYRSLVGNPPPEATARVTNDKLIIPPAVAESLPAYAMSALANALQIRPDDRTESIEAFRDEFSAAPSVINRSRSAVRGDDNMADDNGKNKKKKSGKKHYVIISMVATALALVAIGAVVYFMLFKDSSNSDTAETTTIAATQTYSLNNIDPNIGETPNLVDQKYNKLTSDANLMRSVADYKVQVISKQYSDKALNTILSQDPKPGTQIKKGDTIKVVLSLGPSSLKMPDIIGLSPEDAMYKLIEAGFDLRNMQKPLEVYSTSDDPNSVVDVEPKVGSDVDPDASITFKINSYKPTTAAPTDPPTDPPTQAVQTEPQNNDQESTGNTPMDGDNGDNQDNE